MVNSDRRKRRVGSALIPLTVLSLLAAVPLGMNAFA
jgi:hypothetical protein